MEGARGTCVSAGEGECELTCIVARRLLRSLSIKQGIKYNAPESARDIPAFIAFHNLNIDEVRDPLDSFSTCFDCLSMVLFLT